jgi:hypothetical protein
MQKNNTGAHLRSFGYHLLKLLYTSSCQLTTGKSKGKRQDGNGIEAFDACHRKK